jgi:hypothetical protein
MKSPLWMARNFVTVDIASLPEGKGHRLNIEVDLQKFI